MPTEVAMPRLGWDMQVGSVAEWLKHDGDHVEEGEPICMIAGDKATTELEAPASGILRLAARAPQPGVEVPVGTLLAYLVEQDEAIPSTPDASPPHSVTATQPAEVIAARPAEVTEPVGAVGPPRQREAGLSGAEAGLSGADDTRGGPRIVASPRARRAAAGLGVDWRTLSGTGRGGRILERDVASAAARETQTANGGLVVPANRLPLPLTGIRRLTAERMALSARTVAPVTLVTEANATSLVRLRAQAAAERAAAGDALPGAGDAVHAAGDALPGFTDLLVKIVAVALGEYPALNAELTPTGIVQHPDVNIAIAVDTPAGLVAPVIRSVPDRSIHSIAAESRRLIEAARTMTNRAEDLAGATFTITNLGMYEIDAFTPIVNLPQCAILGVGRIVARPVVVDETTDQIAVQRMLTLSLTFDHRLVDGAPAARFLQRIKHLVERPTLWLFR